MNPLIKILVSASLIPLFPAMLKRGMGFWPSVGAGSVVTAVLYLLTARLLGQIL